MTNTAVASVGQRPRERAIVMGGSITDLAAARVLSNHFREVILVERDQFGTVGEHRRGVPQGRHTHGLLAGGLRVLEGFFPSNTQAQILVPVTPGGFHHFFEKLSSLSSPEPARLEQLAKEYGLEILGPPLS